ncbi:hypothetical protein [Pseudolysinimonas sp.]|uniref:hypothetical protein n=1 Tax=Pseudolysinimonas sp. TaxID=2680009 RepID=UPI003F7D8432
MVGAVIGIIVGIVILGGAGALIWAGVTGFGSKATIGARARRVERNQRAAQKQRDIDARVGAELERRAAERAAH